MINPKDIILTKEGVEQLKAEYRNLIDVQRPEVIEQLQNARAMGDLSENADYDAARNRQAEIEGRISEIETILANAKVAEPSKGKTAQISSIVTYKDLTDDEVYTVKIVSSIESDPLSDANNLKISNVCPLGEALIGHKVGETITVKTTEPYKITIIDLK